MRKTTWNTYYTTGYMYDVANDQKSAGGCHHHQVRKTATGWQKRILQSNGVYRAAGPVSAISPDEGEALYTTAMTR
jgi:hypothetical protein